MYGYANGLLRINLSNRTIKKQQWGENELRKYVGGVGVGAKILYEEVDPSIKWNDAANKIVFSTGPLTGTSQMGSGTFCVVTKGALTGGAASSQANGFFGAFLRFNGWDGIVFEGAANEWVYLYINGSEVEFHSAEHLLGMDTWVVEKEIKKELSLKHASVFSIGPAGENLVHFACIAGDEGHVAAHNGVGAVMGSKKVKAVVVPRTSDRVTLYNKEGFKVAVRKQKEVTRAKPNISSIEVNGTAGGLAGVYARGVLPVKNYTTNLLEGYERLTGQYLRANYEMKPSPCWSCGLKSHCQKVKLDSGPFVGMEAEEPEYECMASLGANLGITDTTKVIELTNYCDRLGVDANEAGWVLGWAMECYEKGFFTSEQLNGLDLSWGNAEDAIELLKLISRREGLGDLLAQGVKVAAETVGGEAKDWAVYTEKGNTPRGHDHRGNWFEHVDTCVSNTGTIESTGRSAQTDQHGIEAAKDPFDWEQVATQNGLMNGRRIFEDCLGICGFCADNIQLMVESVNNATGWDMDIEEAMRIGRRVINLLRLFNIASGISPGKDRPSVRYGSIPKDGPAQGTNIMAVWYDLTKRYYEIMGWSESGYPLPETLKNLGIENNSLLPYRN